MSLLEQIVDSTWSNLEHRRELLPFKELEGALLERSHDRPFSEALVGEDLSLIAEFKRRSPSAGEINPGVEVAHQVNAYEQGGASAISVLTEESYFGGSLDDLRAARAATQLPILRKDFIVDSYMLYESAVAGADAVLLIAAILDEERLASLYGEARSLDLDCLVEVHDEKELELVLAVDADVIGINNRNLSTLNVDVETTYNLIADVPAGKTVVSESGISNREQLDELERVGVDAVLIGEALMQSAEPEQLCRELFPQEEAAQP